MVEQVAQRLECLKIDRSKKIVARGLPEFVIKAMQRVQQIEQRILVRHGAVGVISPEKPVCGGVDRTHTQLPFGQC